MYAEVSDTQSFRRSEYQRFQLSILSVPQIFRPDQTTTFSEDHVCRNLSTQTPRHSVYQNFRDFNLAYPQIVRKSVSSDTWLLSKSEYQRFQLSICLDHQTIICAVDEVISQSNTYIRQTYGSRIIYTSTLNVIIIILLLSNYTLLLLK